jgi:hypothetical protein
VHIVGRDVVCPCFRYFDYCVCTTCQLCTSCLRCTFAKQCTSVAGARIASLCTLDYFVHDTLFMHVCCWCTYCYFVHVTLFTHALQSVITLMLYLFMFYDLLIIFTCANIYIYFYMNASG